MRGATEASLGEVEKNIASLHISEGDESSSDEETVQTEDDLEINSYKAAMQCINYLCDFEAFKGDVELWGFLNNARTITENRIVSKYTARPKNFDGLF